MPIRKRDDSYILSMEFNAIASIIERGELIDAQREGDLIDAESDRINQVIENEKARKMSTIELYCETVE